MATIDDLKWRTPVELWWHYKANHDLGGTTAAEWESRVHTRAGTGTPRSRPLSSAEEHDLENCRLFLLHAIHKLGAAGAWIARGKRGVDVPESWIPADHWKFLKLNIDDAHRERAEGEGVVWLGIRCLIADEIPDGLRAEILDAVQAPHQKAVQAPIPETEAGVSAALNPWYIKRRDNWPIGSDGPGREQDLVDAREALGPSITEEMIRDVRKRLAPSNWQKPGRRRGLAKGQRRGTSSQE